MSADKPFFRFYPGAYEQVFKISDARCAVCDRSCVWEYTGSIYIAQKPTPLCARCVFEGNLSSIAGDDYAFHDIELEGAAPELAEELLLRTPQVACFNPFEWPVISGEPLAFIGYGNDPHVWDNVVARDAINTMLLNEGVAASDEPTGYALVFKKSSSDEYVAVLDLD